MSVEVELIPDRTKMVYVRRVNGEIVARNRFDPNAVAQQNKAAAVLGVGVATLLKWIDSVSTTPVKFLVSREDPGKSEFTIREIDQTDDEGDKVSDPPAAVLTNRLPTIPVGKILKWGDIKAVCCLDIDYHGVTPPEESWLEAVVRSRVAPKPFCWHFSRSGGLHLFYLAAGTFTAEELAAVAGLRFRSIEPTAGIELKKVVRGPGDRPVYYNGVQETTASLTEWIGTGESGNETVEEAVQQYLESEGITIGSRYGHDKCPICPSPDAGDKRDPVVVSDEGIFCHVCDGKGRCLGSRRAGFAPWNTIVGHPTAGDFGYMIRGLAHWGHAKWVLSEKYRMVGKFAQLAYTAALKAYHQGKPTERLVNRVFDPTLDKMARVGKDWYFITDLQPAEQGVNNLIAALPSVMYEDEKGSVKASLASVALYSQAIDLKDYGYPPLRLVFGAKLAAEYLPQPLVATVGVAAKHVQMRGDRYLPRYVLKSERMGLTKAWGLLEQIVPKVDHTLIRLIIAGSGVAQETCRGQSPRLFVTGPSGAAKTAHFSIAGSILGVVVPSITANSSDERFIANIKDAMNGSGVVVVNEIFKDAMRTSKRSPAVAMQPVLNIEPDVQVHQLYKGGRPIGRQCLLAFTEVAMPATMQEETQIARRLRYYRVERRKDDWRAKMAAAGIGEFKEIRTRSPELADACNAILSDVIDEFFVEALTFDEIADRLNIKTIEDSPDFSDPTPYLRHFYKLVCAAEEPKSESMRKRFGRGAKKIDKAMDDNPDGKDLLATYSMFADGSGADWFTSRKLIEKDWSSVLKTDETVRLSLRDDGSSVYVRFVTGPLDRPSRVNQEIINPEGWVTI